MTYSLPPDGNIVTPVDWVQVRRFVASLDTEDTARFEFQRGDCWPRPCGDAVLSYPLGDPTPLLI